MALPHPLDAVDLDRLASATMGRLVAIAGVVAFVFAVSGCDGSAAAPLPPLTGATSVSVGYSHACARMSDGTAKCWGGDALGQLGNGETTFSVPAPTSVVALTGVKSVAAGGSFSCALETEGTVACWGVNTSCELGNGCDLFSMPGSESGMVDEPDPVAVTGISGRVSALVTGSPSDGEDGYTCAVLVDRTVECWGANVLGIDPSPTAVVIPPTPVNGLPGVASLALGGYSACAVLTDGTAVCWGLGPLGQAGGAPSASGTPLPVSGLSGAVGIAVGGFHACALLGDGTVSCWGDNSGAQLGNGTLADSPTPVTVSGVVGAVEIAAADYRTCALISDGTVKCWGGDTTMLTPAAVPALTGALSISVASQSACALVTGGKIECWGDDSSGQLGNGVVSQSGDPAAATPVTVVSGS